MGGRIIDAFVIAQTDGWDDHMDWDGGWILMAIGMVLFWGLVIFGVVWLVRSLGSHDRPQGHAYRPAPGAEDPLAILDRRLAEGSIEVEEYERRKRTLTGGG